MLFEVWFYPFIVVICIAIVKCNAYSDIIRVSTNVSEVYCAPPIKPKRLRRPLQYFIDNKNIDVYSRAFLEDCLLKKRNVGHSVTLLGYEDLFKTPSDDNPYSKIRNLDVYPDFAIFIAELRDDLVNDRIYRFWYSPHFVIIHITLTTRNTLYACEAGVFREGVANTIEIYLNRLWHKYEMFHYVVEIPFMCPGYYIIFKGKRPSGLRLYDRTITSVSSRNPEEVLRKLLESRHALPNNYPLRANIFKRFPTAISNCTNIHYHINIEQKQYLHGFCGMDILMMHDVLLYFKFHVEFPDVDNSGGYGYVDRNGNTTGSLGYLTRDVFDISFNSRFMLRLLDTDEVQFINYISSDEVCAVMRRPEGIPLWHYAFNAFKPLIWVLLLLMFVLTGVIAKVLSKLRSKYVILEEDLDSYNILSYITQGFCGCYNKKLPISIIRGVCLLISISILASYQSNINYMYTNFITFEKMDTLAELREAHVKVYTSPSMVSILGADNMSQFYYGAVDKKMLLENGKLAIIQRKADMMLTNMLNYTDASGWPLLYIVKECFSNFFLSYVARSDFPFISELKIFLMRSIEAGLPDAYYRMTKNSLRLGIPPMKKIKRNSDPRPFFATTLEEQRVAFYVLLMGYTVSTFVLIVERWWARRKQNG